MGMRRDGAEAHRMEFMQNRDGVNEPASDFFFLLSFLFFPFSSSCSFTGAVSR